jgi:hypothetical protein
MLEDGVVFATKIFTVTVNTKCHGQTITATTTTAGSYNLNSAVLDYVPTAFTASAGLCTVIDYTVSYVSGGSGDIFPFTASTRTLAV